LAAGLLAVASPFLLVLAVWRPKYRQSIPARFFLWRNPPLPGERLWFHACSFGETRALSGLLAHFQHDAVLSVTTQTGYEEGKRFVRSVRYLPFEPLLWLWVRPQRVLAVMEAELWFLLFFVAKKRGAKTVLLNARISDRSYGAYRRFAWFYRRLFAYVDVVFAQSETDRLRLKELGAQRVEVAGNIKLANLPKPTRMLPKPPGTVVTAASTHEGEEAGIVAAFFRWRRHHPDARLIVVPRHPERFARVDTLLREACGREGIEYRRWREKGSLDAPVVLIDTMGELVNIYAISDIVVLGGAFVPNVGGHNPAETIPFGCKLISGHEIFNQKAMFEAVDGAIFCELETLENALERALSAPSLRLKQPVSLDKIIEELEKNVV
jgi:3-deoxy-D-manno-octulosonic-acid transferase